MASIPNVPGAANLSLDQRASLAKAAQQIGIPVDWLTTVISFESGGSFSPSKLNLAGSGAFGLIQFMPNTAQNILRTGTREEAVQRGKAMSFDEQLQKMVVPYFKSYTGRLNSLNDVYLAIFYPAAMNQEDNWIIGRAPTKVYSQNAGFDKEGKGYVTRGDVTRTINGIYNSALGTLPLAPDSANGGQIITGLLLSTLAFASYWDWQRRNSRIRAYGKRAAELTARVVDEHQPAWLRKALGA